MIHIRIYSTVCEIAKMNYDNPDATCKIDSS